MHYTDLTRSVNPINSSLLNSVKGYFEIYLRFNRSCKINGLKSRRGYPIYDIVQMYVPNIPLFQLTQVYNNPLLKYMNGVIFGIGMSQIFGHPCICTYFSLRYPVMPYFHIDIMQVFS